MKRIITAVLCIYMSMALWGCAGPAREDAAETKTPSLRETGLELIELMAEMAASDDYVDMAVGNNAVGDIVREIGDEDHSLPEAVYSVTVRGDSVDKLMEMAGISTDMSEELRSYLEQRVTGSLISTVNGMEGAESLAAANICTVEKSFVNKEATGDVIYIYTYEGARPAAVSFRVGDDNAETATGSFITAEDLPLGSEEDIKAFFESLGLDVEVKEVTA